MGKTAVIIPARYKSSRLPGKLLLKVCNKPVIQWVWERASQVKSADMVLIAADNQLIMDAAESFGAKAVMTSESCKSGSDRIAQAAKQYPEYDYIINLQGDEPMINPECIEETIKILKEDNNADISTLVSKITDEDLLNPNMVKCVFDKNGYAMYFSRSKIPYERNFGIAEFYKHIGIYGYKRDALFKMTQLEQPYIERAESLEQLRALYFGMKIKVSAVEYNSIGIDTIEDFNAFKKLAETNTPENLIK